MKISFKAMKVLQLMDFLYDPNDISKACKVLDISESDFSLALNELQKEGFISGLTTN